MTEDHRKNRILIVEDEPDTRIFLTTLLESGGFDPISTGGSATGLRAALTVRPDLIILDIMLANERGIQIYRHLKSDQQLKGVPVIILSAIDPKTFFHYQRFQNIFPKLGISKPDAYLEKPPEADELLRLVRRLTAAAEHRDVAARYENERQGLATGADQGSGPRNP